MLGSSSTKPHEIQMMKSRKNLKAAMPLAMVLGALAFTTSVNAATIINGFTSVDDLDYTNVVGAWNFAKDIGNGTTTTTVQGVGFVGIQDDGIHGNLTVGGLNSGGNSGNVGGLSITSGGTATDQTNLTAIVTNFLNGQQGTNASNDLTLDISGLASNTYKVQYIWSVGGGSTREFIVNAEGAALGTFSTSVNGPNLLTEQIAVTDGTLNIRVTEGPNEATTDERRMLTALIISTVPEPSSTALLGLGGLALLLRRRRA